MTRPFRFSLQKVLEYRSQLEDQAKLELARAERALAEQTALVRRLEHALDAHLEDASRTAPASAAQMWLNRNYAKRLAEDLDQARVVRGRLEQAVRECRAEVVEKAKERKLLEKLKEKQAERHARDEEHKEQAQFDEMATLRYQAPAL